MDVVILVLVARRNVPMRWNAQPARVPGPALRASFAISVGAAGVLRTRFAVLLHQFYPDGGEGDQNDHDEDQVDIRPNPLVPSEPVPEQGYAHPHKRAPIALNAMKTR